MSKKYTAAADRAYIRHICAKKVKIWPENEAQRVLGRMRRYYRDPALIYFRCLVCDKYHIGHRRPDQPMTRKERRQLENLRFKLVRLLERVVKSRA